ncbi:MAG: YncE family protein [Candidatus Zixiibacteriota bacterium]
MGTQPSPDPAGRLYALSQTDSLITIFDTKTFTVTDTFTAPIAAPHYICFAPNSLHYYIVSLEANGRISKFETATNNFLGSVALPGVLPSSIAITADNAFGYVSDFTTQTTVGWVYKIDVGAMTLVDSIPDGATSHDLKITSDGKWVIVSNRDSETVTMIDTDADTVVVVNIDPDSVYAISDPLKYGPFGIAIDHRDSLAFVACIKADQIRVLDIAGRRIVDSIQIPHEHSDLGPHGPTLMAVSPDDNIVYVSTQWSTRIVAASVPTRRVIRTHRFSVGRQFGVTISSDGSRVYTASINEPNQTGRIYAIDGFNQIVVDSADVGLNSFGLIWQAP